MYLAGTAVIAYDAGLRDRYYAVVHKEERDEKRNPLVEIRAVIDYPIQTAIIWPDVASENVPLACGLVCRMPVERRLEMSAFPDYKRSRAEALRRAIEAAHADHRRDILAILLRHKRGAFGRKRRLCDK